MEALKFLILFLGCAHGAKILGVVHVAGTSHHILAFNLLKALADKGHNVTLITPFDDGVPVKNLRIVPLTGALEDVEDDKKTLFDHAEYSIFAKAVWVHYYGSKQTNITLNHPNVQKILKSDERFDLVIMYQFVSDALSGLCYHYQATCVLFTPMFVPYWSHGQIGNPDNPAYTPDLYFRLSSIPSLFERIYNSILYVGVRLLYHLHVLPMQNEILQKAFPGSPHLSELYYNASLVLVNSHPAINGPLPNVPNLIEIGGFHVDELKPLPADLKKYLDGARKGVVYFAMGSNLKSTDLSKHVRESILRVFSKLDMDVLWKWEEENLPNQPPNVMIKKWLPQQDVLAHPNIKVFITQGGLLSMTEAIYFGVPMIGIPVFADQVGNAASAERLGYALSVPYKQFTEEKFGEAIRKMLSNTSYTENVKKMSQIIHDEPMKPRDKAVFWIEYVLRHQGAPHLRSAAVKLYWYQYLLIDVICVVVLSVVAVFTLFVIVVRKLFGLKGVKKISRGKKTE